MWKDLALSAGKAVFKAGVAVLLSNLAQQNLKESGKEALDKLSQTVNSVKNTMAEKKLARTVQ